MMVSTTILLSVLIQIYFSPSGSALDLNFRDINVASLDKELEEQDSSAGLASKNNTRSYSCLFGLSQIL